MVVSLFESQFIKTFAAYPSGPGDSPVLPALPSVSHPAISTCDQAPARDDGWLSPQFTLHPALRVARKPSL